MSDPMDSLEALYHQYQNSEGIVQDFHRGEILYHLCTVDREEWLDITEDSFAWDASVEKLGRYLGKDVAYLVGLQQYCTPAFIQLEDGFQFVRTPDGAWANGDQWFNHIDDIDLDFEYISIADLYNTLEEWGQALREQIESR